MMETQKRHRSPNYSTDEINALLNIIVDFKHVIENKKTDTVTWREKENAWQDIATRFNACSPGGVLRTSESLKKAYENKKRTTRKVVEDRKMSARRTGGGSGSGPTDQNNGLILSLVNDKTVHGLPSPRDNDFEDEVPKHYISQDVNNTDWRERQRPVVSTVNAADLHNKYSDLAKLKSEYVQMQLDRLKEEREMKKYEHQLTIRNLQLDGEIKEAQLKKLKTTY